MADDISDVSSTTLVTFMYQNLQARTVELLGSWDNFSKAYSMKVDSRRGGDQWTGCYTFADITYDGDDSSFSGLRSGGLKMGGTYWYYYSLDGGLSEVHNEAEPYTTSCPLLPGQCVNILEVPYEDLSASQSQPISAFFTHTLDPQDRYVNPRPAPSPKPSLPRLVMPAPTGGDQPFPMLNMSKTWQHPVTPGGSASERGLLSALSISRMRSATTSPSSTVKSALSFLKGLDAAISPFDSGRVRSQTTPAEHARLPPSPRRQQSFNALLKHPSSPPNKPDPSQSSEVHQNWPLHPDPPHRRHVSDSPKSSPNLHNTPFHSRSISAEQTGRQASYQTLSTDNALCFPPRTSSREYTRSPSLPLQASEGVPAERCFSFSNQSQDRTSHDDYFTQSDSGYNSHCSPFEKHAQRSSRSLSDLDKALPPLPAYLIPEPLNINYRIELEQVAIPSTSTSEQAAPLRSRFSEWTVDQSRFSEWTTYSAAHEEALEFQDEDSEYELSPTFSSIYGESLDAMTPRRLSGPFPASLASLAAQVEHLGDDNEQEEEEDVDQVDRPDLDALQQLRDAIINSDLPLHNTFEPVDSFPYMSRTRGRILEYDTTSSLGEITPTATTLKLHETVSATHGPLVAGQSSLVDELVQEFDYLGGFLS